MNNNTRDALCAVLSKSQTRSPNEVLHEYEDSAWHAWRPLSWSKRDLLSGWGRMFTGSPSPVLPSSPQTDAQWQHIITITLCLHAVSLYLAPVI